MEPTAAWGGPFEFQLAATNWTAEEAPAGDAQVWAPPAGGLPLECASIFDIFGSSSCSLQPYVVPASSSSSSGGQQQLVEYNYYNYYAAAAQHHHDPTGKAMTTQEDLPSFQDEKMETYMKNPKKLFQQRKDEFKADADAKLMEMKMHRYPPSIRDLGCRCTVPKVVAIGPYHRHRHDKLKKAEKVKHVAANCCIELSRGSVEELYGAVISAVDKTWARYLYDKDVMEGMGYEDDFLPMMFYDACFLVMYILQRYRREKNHDAELSDFYEFNKNDIAHDMMLLENQIPWQVVDAIINKCTPQPLETKKYFIARWLDDCLQDRSNERWPHVDWDEDYEAPHLLGLLRYYMVGKSSRKLDVSDSELEKMETIQTSAGAVELAEMGVFLTANEATTLPNIGLDRKWVIFKEFQMTPLSLNHARASSLVNMAALELCTTPRFLGGQPREYSAVCSYLLLLCMLMHREEDVHQLRRKGILQGGAGLSNKEALDFFTSLQSLRRGRVYIRVMLEIRAYRMRRWGWWLWLYAFGYRNWKYIVGVGSAFGGFIGILVKLKGAH